MRAVPSSHSVESLHHFASMGRVHCERRHGYCSPTVDDHFEKSHPCCCPSRILPLNSSSFFFFEGGAFSSLPSNPSSTHEKDDQKTVFVSLLLVFPPPPPPRTRTRYSPSSAFFVWAALFGVRIRWRTASASSSFASPPPLPPRCHHFLTGWNWNVAFPPFSPSHADPPHSHDADHYSEW